MICDPMAKTACSTPSRAKIANQPGVNERPLLMDRSAPPNVGNVSVISHSSPGKNPQKSIVTVKSEVLFD
jgi:hypothetical protein